MRKLTTALLFVFLITGASNSFAQTFTQESLVANLGFGFGWYSYGYGVNSFPAVTLSVEKGFKDLEDIGFISIGATAGWKTAKYDWNWFGNTDEWKWRDIVIAARGALHPHFIEVDKVDVYGGLALGVRLENFTWYTIDIAGEPQKVNENNVYPLIGFYAGGRYYFTDNIAVFSELGYGLGYLTLGISVKP